MARIARCPSCGAPVEFRSVASILAVCEFCRSTLVREGNELKNLGRMADLVEDRSRLRCGAEGRWHGLHFAIVGRIQYRFDAGLWNEWHLLFDNGRSGWLSEVAGDYLLSMPRRVPETLPRFESLKPGDALTLDGAAYQVGNVLTAECVAGEGELPFAVGGGYAAPVVDLRSVAGGFATLDYSDNPERPLVFVGESVEIGAMGLTGLRDVSALPEITVGVRAFACPSCGAPLTIAHAKIASVGCGSCGAVVDTSNETLSLIAQASTNLKVEPLLPLGATGTWRGMAVEIVGFMRRHMEADGIAYRWSEYLLLGPAGKVLWLTEYQGHWNFAQVLPRAVKAGLNTVLFESETYKHFQGYDAYVDFVIGEFPWRVTIGEAVHVEDYLAPPRLLSRETTASDDSWTLAEYIDATEIAAAFALDYELARPVGVFANQPNPHQETHRAVCGRFWKFLLAGLAVHGALMFFGSGGRLLDQSFVFAPNDDEPQLSREFRLAAHTHRLEVEHDTDLANSWVSLGLTLVNKDTGEAWQAVREISRYEGVEDGESWSEGSRTDAVVFANLPAGTYVLAEEADLDARSRPVRAKVRVAQAGPRWSSLAVLSLMLALFPIYTRVRRGSFEIKRWADSDHPLVTASDGDGDGDSDSDSGGSDGGD